MLLGFGPRLLERLREAFAVGPVNLPDLLVDCHDLLWREVHEGADNALCTRAQTIPKIILGPDKYPLARFQQARA